MLVHADYWSRSRDTGTLPITMDDLLERLETAEALLLHALRSLAEVGDAQALRPSVDIGASHAAPLAQLQQAQEQLERYSAILDFLSSTKH